MKRIFREITVMENLNFHILFIFFYRHECQTFIERNLSIIRHAQ